MTIITAEDDYQVVTIESKSEASTLDEFIDIFRGIAVALNYDAEQVAERLPTQEELDEREEITLPPRNSGFGGGHVGSIPNPGKSPSAFNLWVGKY
jgi:hypothetical protein